MLNLKVLSDHPQLSQIYICVYGYRKCLKYEGCFIRGKRTPPSFSPNASQLSSSWFSISLCSLNGVDGSRRKAWVFALAVCYHVRFKAKVKWDKMFRYGFYKLRGFLLQGSCEAQCTATTWQRVSLAYRGYLQSFRNKSEYISFSLE